MCEGLQQTPAEVTAAESVRNAPQELATDVERLSLWRFLTVRLKKQTEEDLLNADLRSRRASAEKLPGTHKALKTNSASQKEVSENQ
ncbi:hypothetical protein TNCV_998461 [Trichonephila clavipes]|nr:hypothetical protein TNCV_998461 [Trichonephila clavipes]